MSQARSPKPKRGEIWGAVLDPVEGSEMGGHNVGEQRPVVVLSMAGKGRVGMHVCVPLTTFQDEHAFLSWCVIVVPEDSNGLSRISTAETSQIRALSMNRLQKKWGVIGDIELRAMGAALNALLGFELPST